MKRMICLLVLFCCLLPLSVIAEVNLKAMKVDQLPVIDGVKDDDVWLKAKSVVIRDAVADIDMKVSAVHDGASLSIVVEFPDATEDRYHRALVWNDDIKSYQNGPTREDVMVLKWSMVPYQTGLTLKEDRPYRADMWFWKAHRTDHAGYADDKIQYYSTTRERKAQLLVSESGRVFYLVRKGDSGTPAYMPKLYSSLVKKVMPKYNFVTPTGSRADIRAKGNWVNGRWTIEFNRALQTGNGDDIQLSVGNSYRLGVSRYEIAGRQPDEKSEQPLYGSGDVGEILILEITP